MKRAGVALLVTLLPLSPAAGQAAFFRTDSVLAITLRTDLRALFRDRTHGTAPWHEATIAWAAPAGTATVPLRVRTRGLFRLRHCDVPPIRLRFSQDSVRGSPFEDLHRPKLATHCMDRTEYEQNLLQEYAIYRVYQLFTPLSYRARLVRVTWEDVAGARRPVSRYGVVLEDPDHFIERVGGTAVAEPGTRFGQIDPANAALLGVFEYFVANTDWSLPGLHNVAVLRMPDGVRAVPFDFDWSGVIDARYAVPAPQLHTRSVRERVYRGFCQDEAALEPVLARFEQLKDSIAAVYRAVPDLDPGVVERTLRYYGEFYQNIGDRRRFVRNVVQPTCLR